MPAPAVLDTPEARSAPPDFLRKRPAPRPFVTMSAAEYHAYVKGSVFKSEYINGKVFKMAGATLEHNQIAPDTLREFGNRLEEAGADCEEMGSDMKVYINPHIYYYPDGVIVCGSPQVDFEEALRNPTVIIEVTSRSTATDDHTEKFANYQKIETLAHYLLIEQERVAVTHYAKNADNIWTVVGIYTHLADHLSLILGGKTTTVPIARVYRRVPFQTESP